MSKSVSAEKYIQNKRLHELKLLHKNKNMETSTKTQVTQKAICRNDVKRCLASAARGSHSRRLDSSEGQALLPPQQGIIMEGH